jgi:hypothetical protein
MAERCVGGSIPPLPNVKGIIPTVCRLFRCQLHKLPPSPFLIWEGGFFYVLYFPRKFVEIRGIAK